MPNVSSNSPPGMAPTAGARLHRHHDWRAEFECGRRQHQERSRQGSEQKFSGGLANPGSQRVVRMHTATHLLGGFRIVNQTSSGAGAGVRRIKAVVE